MTYADHGDRAGPVLLECVGTPQSRLPFPGQAPTRTSRNTRSPAATGPTCSPAEELPTGAGHGLTDIWPDVYGWLLARSATTSTSNPSPSAR